MRVFAGLAQRRGVFVVPEQVLRTRATGLLCRVGVHGDLLDLTVSQVLGSWDSFEVSGLVEGGIDLGVAPAVALGVSGEFSHVADLVPVLVSLRGCGRARAGPLGMGTSGGLSADTALLSVRHGCCPGLMCMVAGGPEDQAGTPARSARVMVTVR